ncbi:MAG: hypothetical protein ACLFUH_04640, partial [Bacteroidales bacterium]
MLEEQVKADQQMKKLQSLTKKEHKQKHGLEKVNIALSAREILEKKIDEAIEKYPNALKVEHLQIIMSHKKDDVISQSQIYEMLGNGEIPGAKKIPGLSWRVPALTFFA